MSLSIQVNNRVKKLEFSMRAHLLQDRGWRNTTDMDETINYAENVMNLLLLESPKGHGMDYSA